MTTTNRLPRIPGWISISVSMMGVLFAAYLWSFLIAYITLWGCVFGDNTDPEGYAIAIALPISAVATLIYWRYCVHNNVSMRFQMTSLFVSLSLVAIFLYLSSGNVPVFEAKV